MEAVDQQNQRGERAEKTKSDRSKPVDRATLSVITVVRRCRQESEQFTAELLALEESDANSKEMDAMFSNILTRFFIRKAKYMRTFDEVPIQFINEVGKALVARHKQFKMNEFAREMMSIYEQDTGGKVQPPVIPELAKAMSTATDASGHVAKRQHTEEEDKTSESSTFQDKL